jgi:DNA polymerase delta subunit 2
VDGVRFLGTAGQNVDDVYKYSGLEDRLSIMEHILQWGHLIPTAPDTLAAYPFPDRDPFVLETAPHVFFAGNQPELGTRLVQGRIYCLKNGSLA